MKNILKSAALLLAIFLFTLQNNTVKAQCPISIVSVTMTPVSCFGGSDGTLTVTISGGVAPYDYAAIRIPFVATFTGNATSHTFTGLPAGLFTVVVESANDECTASTTITVTQPAAALTVGMSSTPVTCNGGNNGTATATPAGGTGPYTYAWSPSGQTTQTATGLNAGSHSVVVTDNNSCTANGNVTVTQPAGMTQSTSITNVSCNGQNNGAIDLTVNGGTPGYTYLWSPGGQTTQDLSGITAGTYSVLITDANSCTLNVPGLVVGQPAVLTSSETHVNVNCAGSNTGSIDLSVSGGTSPYSYLWNTGQTTQDLSGLAPGFYNVNITDANGCSTSRGVTITQLSNLSVSSFITNATCGSSNGAVDITISGGSGNYTYSWSPGGATTQDISGINAGTYTVTVTDVTFGCTEILSNNVQNSGSPTISAVVTNTSNCNSNDGSIDVSVTGGSGSYTYSWSPSGQTTQDRIGLVAGSYTITVTDAGTGCIAISTFNVSFNGAMTLSASSTDSDCNSNSGAIDLTVSGGTPSFSYAWSNGATTQDLTNIGPGIYNVTVTDNNGCTENSNFSVNGANGITITSTQNNILCTGDANGSIDLTVSGGTGIYNYSWSNGSTQQDINGLSPGTYSVSVTDAGNGCSSFLLFTITEPDELDGSIDVFHVSCNGGNDGAIDLTINSGATPPFSYLWTPGGETTQDINNLTAGTYTLSISDMNGCTGIADFEITEPSAIALSETHVNVSCAGGTNGSVDLSVSGGIAPYTYGWSNGATTQDISGLAAGFYSVTVTDNNGCTANLNVTITELSNLTVNIVSVVNSQCNADNGSIDISISGGSGNYTYSWNTVPVQTTQDISGLGAGTYTVTVTDVTLGCMQSSPINVSETGAPTVSGTVTPASDCSASNGAIDVSVSGGSGSYSYLWSPSGQTTQDRTGLAPGTYNVTVTDIVSGCSGVSSFVVTAGSTMSLTASVTNATCGANDGAIDLSVSGGTGPYTYVWTNGATTQDINSLPSAIYGVTVTDNNSCTANAFFPVNGVSAMVLSTSVTNISCAGGTNGAIDLTVSGGSGSYTYLWSTGATTQDLSSIPAGSYSVNVTDAGTGCVSSAIYSVTEPSPISLSTNITHITCNGGGPTGAIDLTVSGGTGPYSYSWSPGGQTTQDLSGLAAGNYTLTFSDANGCGGTYVFTVTQPTAISITETHVNVTCNGLNNGSIDISVSGGTAPYTYLWAPGGQTTQDLTGLTPNTYTVTVTDNNGCTANLPVTITQPAVLSATETHTNVTCFGLNNGAIDVTVNGGTGPYTYLWTPAGQTTQDRTGLAPNTYSVVITDANGCTTSINNIVITQPASVLNANISPSTNVTCFGLCNGTATANGVGGTPGYTYSWNTTPVQTTQTATNLCSGVYTVTVTDANGCTAQSSVTISQPAQLVASATMTPASCQGICDGTATASQTGGTPSYTYEWIPGGQTTITISGQCAGTYQVVVTGQNGCSDTATVVITEPLTITYTTSVTDATCNGLCDGAATVNPTGGTTPYTYLWSPGGQTTQTVTGLCAGIYNVTITDANGCSTIATVTVNNATAIVTNIASNDPTCNGVCDGSITATASGGTAPYSYLWSPGGQTTGTITNLCAGNYTVTVTDANGCQQSTPVTLTEPTPIVVTPTTTPATCNGVCDGTASVAVSGGTPGYTYLWSPGGQTTSSLTGLCAGNYSVLVTDANGCTQNVNITVSEPSAITLNTVVVHISCNGQTDGSIDLVVSGGTPGYTYLWDNGQTTEDISNLAPGTYSVTVTDANGCTENTSATVNEPAPITITTSSTPATCGLCDATATITAAGGTAPYTYLWGTGETASTATNLCAGVYPVYVTDANGCVGSFAIPISNLGGPTSANVSTTPTSCFGTCDGSATVTPVGGAAPYTYLWVPGGQTTSSVSGLCGGTYNVQIADTNSCILTETVVISEPAQIIANQTVNTADCGLCNGSISLAPSGGTSPYTYLWGGGETTNSISGLCAGVYTVDITDANGCTESLAIPVNNVPASSIVLSSTPATCNGVCDGTATVTVTLGTAPFTYLWSDGQTDATATGLCAGVYTVQVTDANGCIATDLITITQPSPVALSLLVVQNSSCSGSCNGSIDVIPSGGTLPYTFTWSPSVSNSFNASNLCAGVYNVTVTDANGCSQSTSGTITDPTGLSATISGTDVDCNGNCNGTATVTPSGGTLGYTYLWDDPGAQTTQTATGLCAGTYSVTVTDANGCTFSISITITEPAALSTSFSNVVDLSCSGTCDGQATVDVSGGTPGYTYSWNTIPVQSTQTATGLCAQTYTVTITDANGCITQDNVTLTAPNGLTISTTQTDVTCSGLCDGTADATVTGGVSPYTYLWSDPFGQTTTTATSLCAGTYTLTVTDANSCIATANVTILEPAPITATQSSTAATCGQCDGTGTVTVSGGTAPYSYLWANGETTNNASNLCAGVHFVSVTDANGCMQSFSVPVSNTSGPTSATVSTNDVSCVGVCDGTATLVASGGAAPYTYLWLPGGETTDNISGLCAGTYFVQVSDTNNCTLTETYTISEPSQIVANEVVINTDCGLCNGDITLNPSGGSSPYTYLWGGGETTNSLTGLCAGIYTVTITDANNCSETVNITVTNPQNSVLAVSSTPVTCNGACDGTATVTVTSGNSPYTYLWSDGQTNATATALCPGTYVVIVTDAGGCVSTTQITVTEPSQLATSLPVVFNVSCNSLCDGSINIIASGGTLPYSYLWSDAQTTATATGLCAGSYDVTITDANGCSVTLTGIVVTEPAPIVLTTSWTDAQCFGACDGTATVTATGGTPPYTYLWSDGQTTQTATGLCAGTYTVDVTDANGCVETISVTISEPTDIILTTDMQPASCNGVCDGSAWVVATGGTPSVISGYTYSWNPTSQTGDTATALCAGVYIVTVTDSLGCVKSATINVTEPAPVTISFAVNDVTCFGFCNGDITATPSGGTAPYTYQWLNTPNMETINFVDSLCPGEYVLLVTDANGCTAQDTAVVTEPTLLVADATVNNNVSCGGLCDASATVNASGGTPGYSYLWTPSGQTTATATGLCAGTYIVEVTDQNGCVTPDTIIITEPPILTLFPTTTNASCGGVCDGTATANVGGGTPPYQYAWSDGQTTQTAINLCAGNYSVLVTDANGCTISVSVIILEPPILTSSITNVSQILCVGNCDGEATVSVNGGVSPYTYLWSDGQTTQTADTLCIGTYTVVVTDAIGCTTTSTVIINDDNALATAPTSTNVSCFGDCDGSATVVITGGVTPYTVQWDDPNNQTGVTATNLCPGTYTATVTDAANCVSVSTVTITEPTLLTSSASGVDATCGGTCDGTATVTAQGGTLPYTYLWVPGGQTGSTLTGLCAGNYTVTVTDANGCTSQSTVTISEPPVLLASASVTSPSCTNTDDGAINLTVTGGVSPYDYDWSNGATTEDLNDLLPGVYDVTATDDVGCSVTLSVTVTEQVVINVDAGPDQVICIGETVQLQANGANSYLWTPASGLNYNNIDDPIATITTTTTYIVQGTSFGCVDYDTITIVVNPLPVINAGAGASILAGTSVQLEASGAGTNGTYSWTPTTGLDNPDIYNPIASPNETTIYYVTGTDTNGCSASDSLTINVSIGIVFPDGITPNNDGKNDTWIIDFISEFPNAEVMVYNRWGQELFYSKGYGTPWDGRYKGKDLPVGTYYYVIDLHDGTTEPYTGPITIAR